jgi:hypothetical protein
VDEPPAWTHVTLLVTTVRSSDTLLRAVSGSVTLLSTVVALHGGTLDTLVGALVGPVSGLLTVVANLRPLVVTPLGRTGSGLVTESTTVVTVSSGSSSESARGSSLGTVTGHVYEKKCRCLASRHDR